MTSDVMRPDDAILDEVVHLREWATDRIHLLPRMQSLDHIVGESEGEELTPTGQRTPWSHVRLTYARQQQRWWIHDLERRSGLRQDGVHRDAFMLVPGVEIAIGGTILIAENRRSIALRAFCQRLLGWASDPALVDHALRSIRAAKIRRAALVLLGDGDLVPVAHALHRRTLGLAAPFVVCDRRRRDISASIRSPANHESGVDALEAASGGTLCVRGRRLPSDFPALVDRLHVADRSAQLMVLDRGDRRLLLAGPMPICLPPLSSRVLELPRIIEEYAAEAIIALNASPTCFTRIDLEWVLTYAATSLDEIEKACQRIVALNASSNLSQAAGLLGMAPVSLSRWVSRRSPLEMVCTRRLVPPPSDDTGGNRGDGPGPRQLTDATHNSMGDT